ncbi:hypothetical protein A5662_03690 [Mycobacteriaceae bacterium 1482268.1]|nr:hypothetical protein A5662_03690 [Mycobacteriaceae bacterium 1482268.1]
MAEPPGATMRFQFAGKKTWCVPYRVSVLLHVCETDSPAGKSNSSLQSVSGPMLELVMTKRAMKPVCQDDVTANFAVADAACDTGLTASPRTTTTNTGTVRDGHHTSCIQSRMVTAVAQSPYPPPVTANRLARNRWYAARFSVAARRSSSTPAPNGATALADRPRAAVIDMAGAGFGSDPLRIVALHLAAGYWLDHLLPMTGIDARSVAAV